MGNSYDSLSVLVLIALGRRISIQKVFKRLYIFNSKILGMIALNLLRFSSIVSHVKVFLRKFNEMTCILIICEIDNLTSRLS